MTRKEFDELSLEQQIYTLETDDDFEGLKDLIGSDYDIYDTEIFSSYVDEQIADHLRWNSWQNLAECLKFLYDNVGYHDGFVYKGYDEGWDEFETLDEYTLADIINQYSDTDEYAEAFQPEKERSLSFEGVEELIA